MAKKKEAERGYVGLKNRSREEALALGLTHYNAGKPCVAGHDADRYVSNTHCVECKYEWNAEALPELREYKKKHRMCLGGMDHPKPKRGNWCDDCAEKRAARYDDCVARGVCPGGETHAKPTGDHVFCDDCLTQISKKNTEGYRARIEAGFCAKAKSHKKPTKGNIFCAACLRYKARTQQTIRDRNKAAAARAALAKGAL